MFKKFKCLNQNYQNYNILYLNLINLNGREAPFKIPNFGVY